MDGTKQPLEKRQRIAMYKDMNFHIVHDILCQLKMYKDKE